VRRGDALNAEGGTGRRCLMGDEPKCEDLQEGAVEKKRNRIKRDYNALQRQRGFGAATAIST
jgi:hypothetical protein